MNRENNYPVRGLPDNVDEVPADQETMFPKPAPDKVEQKADASVGIEDPRKEVEAPEGISAPFADD
jgi:hypothetical protein